MLHIGVAVFRTVWTANMKLIRFSEVIWDFFIKGAKLAFLTNRERSIEMSFDSYV